MSLHYASPLHHPDDPGGLIGEAFAMGTDFPGPAEDLFLAWSLRLPIGCDSAAAAARLLQRYAPTDGETPGDACGRPIDACGRLAELLRQAAQGEALSYGRRPARRGRRGRQASRVTRDSD